MVYARLGLFLDPKEKLKITFKGYELRACLLNVDFYGTAYKMNSTELELEVCHQKYVSWHGSMVYSLFRIFEKVSFGSYYGFFFLSASALNLVSLFILFVTSKSIGLLVALQTMIISCSLF